MQAIIARMIIGLHRFINSNRPTTGVQFNLDGSAQYIDILLSHKCRIVHSVLTTSVNNIPRGIDIMRFSSDNPL